MIKINSLVKKFNKGKSNEVIALKSMNLTLEDTGLFAIFGKSGSGKSTLMNMIGGLDKFDGGTIEMDGNSYAKLVDDKYRIDNIGYIFQNYCLDTSLNVYDNVALGLRTIGITDEELIFTRTMTALANVDMEEYFKRDITTLSGGQQQRVAIARVMAKGSKIILADEPTGNLDEYNTRLVMDILKEVSKTSLVILVTHEKDIVDRYADKIIFVGDGEIKGEFEGAPTSSEDIVVKKSKPSNEIYIGDKVARGYGAENVVFEFYGDIKPCKIQLVEHEGKYYMSTDLPRLTLVDNNSAIHLTTEEHEQAVEVVKSNDIVLHELGRIEPKSSKKVFKASTSFVEGFKHTFGQGSKLKGKILAICILLLTISVMMVTGIMGGHIYNYNHPDGIIPNETVLISVDNDTEKAFVFDYAKANDYAVTMTAGSGDILSVEPFESTNMFLALDNVIYRDKTSIKDGHFVAGKYTDDIHGIILTDGYVEALFVNRGYKYNKNMLDKMIGAIMYDKDIDGKTSICGAGKVVGIVKGEPNLIYASPAFIANKSLEGGQVVKIADVYGIDIPDGMVYIGNESPNIVRFDETQGLITYNRYGYVDLFTSKAKMIDREFLESKIGDSRYTNMIFITYDTFKSNEKQLIATSGDTPYLYVQAKDVDKVSNDMLAKSDMFQAYNITSHVKQLANWRSMSRDMVIIQLVVLLVLFVLMMVLLALLMFSSFAGKVKEVGIYRAIGVSKANIAAKIFMENLPTLLISIGLAIVFVGLPIAIKTAAQPVLGICLSWWLLCVVSLVIMAFACLFSVLPLLTLLRKTPREILTKYDL